METSASTLEKKQDHRSRVLIVEDDTAAASAMAELLEDLGCDADIAADGLTAIERTTEWRPDIVLLDIGLPSMNGYDVARRIREIPEVRSTLIIAITGFSETEDKKRAYEVGIDLHLTKPVKIGFIKELISVYGK